LGEFPRLPRDEHGEVVLPIAIPPAEAGGMIPSLFDIKIYSEGGEENDQQTDGMEEPRDGQGSSSSHQRQYADGEEEDFETQLKKRMEAQKQEREQRHKQEAPSFNFYRDINEQSPEKRKRSPKKSTRDDSDDENGLVIMDDREEDSSQRGSI